MKIILGILAAIVLAGLAFVADLQRDSNRKLDAIALQRKEAPTMAQLSTTWVDRNGISHTVTTNKITDESDTQHATRHKAAVDAMLVIYPKA